MKGEYSISNQPTSETVSTTGGTVVTHTLQQSARAGTGTGNNVTNISTKTNSASATTTGTSNDSGSTTWFGKFILFVVFPFLGGSLGLFVSYLQTLSSSSSSSSSKSSSHQQYLDLKHEISIDRDFICPFLLTLALVVIITIQTSNFRSKDVKSILPWPTIKKVQRRVVVVSKSTTESSQKQKQKRKED